MKLKLYTNPESRGMIVEWYIRELNLEKDTDFIALDLKKDEQKAPDYLKIHPFGRVPALIDGDTTLMESGAILMYLAEKYGKVESLAARTKAAEWIFFANTTLCDAAFSPEHRDVWMPEVLGVLDKIFSERDYIQGGDFTVADAALGSSLWWLPSAVPEFKLEGYPNVVKYVNRMKLRPAFKDTVHDPETPPGPTLEPAGTPAEVAK